MRKNQKRAAMRRYREKYTERKTGAKAKKRREAKEAMRGEEE
jgi:hypothetical protein